MIVLLSIALHEHTTATRKNINKHLVARALSGRMWSRRLPLPAVALLVSGTLVMTSAIPADALFRRGDASQCPVANFDSCPQIAENHWPDNFCCQSGSTCVSLAGNTTLLCCPADTNCTIITPMGCQIDLYNADLHPDSMVKTTVLNGVLGHCGTGTCCPFGYDCGVDSSGAAACFESSNQNARPLTPLTTISANPSATAGSSSSASAVSPSSAATTAAHTTQSGSTQASPASSSTGISIPGENSGTSSGADTAATETAQSTNNGTPTAVIAGASVGAALLIAAVAFIAFIFFKRRHKKQVEDADALKLTRSTSSFGNIISNPIVAENSTMRTDFVRKSPGRSSMASGLSLSTLVDGEGLPVTPSPARTRDGGSAARIPTIRNMAQARQSSIAYGIGAPDTSPYSGGNYHAVAPPQAPYPQTPPGQTGGLGQEREPSSISISVFADPRIATTPDLRRQSHLTTFSDMLRSADLGGVAEGEPFVPGSQAGTPASRRR